MMNQCSLFAIDKAGHPKQWSVADAERFAKKASPQYTTFLLNKLNVASSENVLDLGCGPGTLTIPLLESARSVTAVDSSPGMLQVLKKCAREKELKNLVCVNRTWRDAVLGKDFQEHYEVALASNSINLLGLKEFTAADGSPCLDWNLEDALLKLNAVAERVYVTMPLMRHNVSETFKAFGYPYNPFPGYLIVHNVVCQLGIQPDVRYFVVHEEGFNESERMAERMKWILNLEPDKLSQIRDKLPGYLDESEKGLQIWSLMSWTN
jgi:SAM-dependent methyltransferase